MGTVKPIFDEQQTAERVDHLAASIASSINSDFIVVGLLKGYFMLVADRGGLRGRLAGIQLWQQQEELGAGQNHQ